MVFSPGFNFDCPVLAKGLIGKSVSDMTCLVSSGTLKDSVNQSINQERTKRQHYISEICSVIHPQIRRRCRFYRFVLSSEFSVGCFVCQARPPSHVAVRVIEEVCSDCRGREISRLKHSMKKNIRYVLEWTPRPKKELWLRPPCIKSG